LKLSKAKSGMGLTIDEDEVMKEARAMRADDPAAAQAADVAGDNIGQPRQDNKRPLCPVHGGQMTAYCSKYVTYYHCEIDGCDQTGKSPRPQPQPPNCPTHGTPMVFAFPSGPRSYFECCEKGCRQKVSILRPAAVARHKKDMNRPKP
jgi:hypothetical protein